jgi:excinuclease ABC subunit A
MKLFCQTGRTFSPTSGREVKKNTVTDVVTDVKRSAANGYFSLHISKRGGNWKTKVLLQQGSRVLLDDKMIRLDEITDSR